MNVYINVWLEKRFMKEVRIIFLAHPLCVKRHPWHFESSKKRTRSEEVPLITTAASQNTKRRDVSWPFSTKSREADGLTADCISWARGSILSSFQRGATSLKIHDSCWIFRLFKMRNDNLGQKTLKHVKIGISHAHSVHLRGLFFFFGAFAINLS